MILGSRTTIDKMADNYDEAYFEALERLAKQIADYIIKNNLIVTREEFNIEEYKWELIGYIEVKERK